MAQIVVNRGGKVCCLGGRSKAAGAARWLRGLGFSNRVVREHLLSCQLAFAVHCQNGGSMPLRARYVELSVSRRYSDLARSFRVFR